MNWLKLIVGTAELPAEQVEEILEELGAQAVMLEDAGDEPLLEPGVGETPLWQQTLVSGLFPAERGGQTLGEALLAAWPGNEQPNWEVEVLEDRDWSLVWSQHARPQRIRDDFWISPGEQESDIPDTATVVRIPPGLAFGTGTHPTTAMCLAWLADTVGDGDRVMDYGSGSGILAVSAARLGATEIIAVDNDPQALQATLENARANGVADRLSVHDPESCPALKVDLVVANILANPLIELAPRLAGLLPSGGRIALTGILQEQAEDVAAAYRPDFPDLEFERQEEWVLLHGRKA
ncbi:50S ribosomal protein L11 methyltransferase [Gammaproteobacteria bacterium AB-CW1]|uniref:Ribosomal protein L11 methyltransferase n=1 Tax=Natronospira elongata TaxID=3110268 RepID=A0AAP6JG98_9GAMM|nr:50S ribosomal protein L11 methyltransferase [Gammaproteobacteria bacterium AB-CW1]